MKIVLNKDYGGFGYGVAPEYGDFVRNCNDRTNPELVAFVESHPDKCGDLEVVEIPDETTDWDIDEHDGWETLIHVVGGKIHYA